MDIHQMIVERGRWQDYLRELRIDYKWHIDNHAGDNTLSILSGAIDDIEIKISVLDELISDDLIPQKQLWRHNPDFYEMWLDERENSELPEVRRMPFYKWFDQFDNQPNAVVYYSQVAK